MSTIKEGNNQENSLIISGIQPILIPKVKK
jgi:hypothetical protein